MAFIERKVQKSSLNNLVAGIVPDSWDEKTKTIEVIASTGSKGLRWIYGEGVVYESLDLTKANLDRFIDGPLGDNHDYWGGVNRTVKGRVLKAQVEKDSSSESGYVLRATLLLSDVSDEEKEIIEKVKRGVINKISIGYLVQKYEDISEENDKRRHLRAVVWQPIEVSWVAIPFDNEARARGIDENGKKIKLPENDCTVIPISDYSKRTYFDEDTTMEKCKKCAKATDELTNGICPSCITEDNPTRNEPTPPANGPETFTRKQVENMLAKAVAENEKKARELQERKESLYTRAEKLGLERSLIDEALKENLTDEAIYSRMIDKKTEQDSEGAPNTVGNTFQPGTSSSEKTVRFMEEVIQARMMGVDDKTSREAAQFSSATFGSQARYLLGRTGISGFDMATDSQVIDRALMTTDFPKLLANSASKYLLNQYDLMEPVWMPLAGIRFNKDFNESEYVRVGRTGGLQPIGTENGDYPTSKKPSEAAEKNKVGQYGEMMEISRKLLINDDLNGIMQSLNSLAQGAVDLESDLFYGVLQGNPQMADGKELFHTDHNNKGMKKYFGHSALQAARQKFRRQRELSLKDGTQMRPLNLAIEYTLLPSSMEDMADRYFTSAFQATRAGDVNPFNKIKPLIDPILDDHSPHFYYHFSNLMRGKAIELVFLTGQRKPVIGRDTKFENDGVRIKIRHEVGAAPIDYRFVQRQEHNPLGTPDPLGYVNVNGPVTVSGAVDANVTNTELPTREVEQ